MNLFKKNQKIAPKKWKRLKLNKPDLLFKFILYTFIYKLIQY